MDDPVRVAQVVLRLAGSDQLPAHLLLGSDAVHYADQAEASRAADLETLARNQCFDRLRC